MTWRMRLDVEDDDGHSESRWRSRLVVFAVIVGVSLWLIGLATLVAWLARHL